MIQAARLAFDPFVSWPVFWILAGIGALALLIYAFRGGRAWLTRALGFTALMAALTAAPVLELAPAGAGSRTRRAATFIEYALLAGIALVLFFLFRSQLSNIFGDLFDRIADAISGS